MPVYISIRQFDCKGFFCESPALRRTRMKPGVCIDRAPGFLSKRVASTRICAESRGQAYYLNLCRIPGSGLLFAIRTCEILLLNHFISELNAGIALGESQIAGLTPVLVLIHTWLNFQARAQPRDQSNSFTAGQSRRLTSDGEAAAKEASQRQELAALFSQRSERTQAEPAQLLFANQKILTNRREDVDQDDLFVHHRGAVKSV